MAEAARDHGVPRRSWNTKQDNGTARALYDKVGRFDGFIVYTYLPD